MKRYLLPLGMWLLFETIAVTLWLAMDNLFYLMNFTYIGTCLALGIVLFVRRHTHARSLVQFAVGLYMLVYLGMVCNENMQLEGFWYYLSLGVFEASLIHYAVAKIFGPLLFGRGWCGYACWTAMVLDVLPYKSAQKPRVPLGFVRYIMFVASFLLVGTLVVLNVPDMPRIMLWLFIAGNALYYAIGVTLAYTLHDNRAFCKYGCPITVFLKPASYFSLLRVKIHEEKCISCGKCKQVCPMDVDMMDNSRKRLHGTECILCMQCIDACPTQALYL
ncbi:MAG: 4Fe-4S binding protein [Sphaerochaeta sp.]|nr:4Fe-4S binding protein [Sphaerochaeta sp.]